MKEGHKHLIKCRCVLPHLRGLPQPPQHQFVVFSILEDDVPILKYAQCNNCGILHKVTDICKSEILAGKEHMSSIMTIDDIKQNLPKNLVDILERHNAELPSWEHAAFVLENKQWGNFVILTQEKEDGAIHGKYVRLLGETFFKIETFTREEILVEK